MTFFYEIIAAHSRLKSRVCGDYFINILEHREYTGCTVAFKTYTNSIWDKTKHENPIENQQITPNTHEAIISEEVFEKVQEIRKSRHRRTSTGKSTIFSGLIYCYDCDSPMYFCTTKDFNNSQDFFEYSEHHKNLSKCVTHFIRSEVMKNLVWEHLTAVVPYVTFHEEYFRRFMEQYLYAEISEKTEIRKNQLLNYLKKNYGYNVDTEILNESNFIKKEYKNYFLGSQGKKVTVEATEPDDFTLYYPKFKTNLHCFIPDKNIDETGNITIIYDMSQVEKKDYYSLNPYAAYSYGDQPIMQITNELIKYDFVGFIPINALIRPANESKTDMDKEISA